jgi:hypothetical protein
VTRTYKPGPIGPSRLKVMTNIVAFQATCATVPIAIDASALAMFGLDNAWRIAAHRLARRHDEPFVMMGGSVGVAGPCGRSVIALSIQLADLVKSESDLSARGRS